MDTSSKIQIISAITVFMAIGTLVGGIYAIVKAIKSKNQLLVIFSTVAFFLPPAGIVSGLVAFIVSKKASNT